jgi:hypothetical protein
LPPELRTGDVRVWTEAALVVWGGNENSGDAPHADDGWTLDPGTLEWRRIAPAPLAPRSWAGGVWTGDEVIVWGGSSGGWPGEDQLSDGAAYDPEQDRWRSIAPSPLDAVAPAVSVWTGTEAIFWGSLEDGVVATGAAYDPEFDRWRVLPAAPDDLRQAVVGTWTGEEVVVLGGHDRQNEYQAASLAYDSIGDRWRTLPPPALDDNLIDVTSLGRAAIAVDTYKRVAILPPSAEAWTSLPHAPTDTCEGRLSIGGTAEAVVVGICTDVVAWTPGSARWHVPEPGPEVRSLYADAGAVVLVNVDEGTDERRLLAFRPPPPDDTATVQDAIDLATAFAALRSNYPYGDGDVPAIVAADIQTMLSPEGAAVFDQGGLAPLWAYYIRFDVGPVDERNGTFEVRIQLSAYGGPDADEVIVMAPGADLDGNAQELVIVDARPN